MFHINKEASISSMRQVYWSLAFFIFLASALGQDIAPEMRAELLQRVNLQRNWGARSNSPGTELSGVETSAVPVGNGIRAHMYELRAKGFPADLDYDLLTLPTMARSSDEAQTTDTVKVEKPEGRVMNEPGHPSTIIVPDPAPGEPYRFALTSKDGKHKAFVTLLPNPIEASENGCKISVIRLMPNFELALVQGTGFPPQTEVDFQGNSEGEVHGWKLKTDDEGYVDIPILPYKKGKSKGSIEIRMASAKCTPKVSFKWGSTK
jgi:hypothetical protein